MLEEDTLDLTNRLSATNQLRRDLQLKLSIVDEENLELTQKRDRLLQKNTELQTQVKQLDHLRQQLEDEQTEFAAERRRFEQDAARLTEEKASLSGELRAVGEQYRLTKEELDFLRAEYTDEVVAFKKEREIMREELEALEILKARYTELESDYNRLVKPARSKVGRYVVSIHYWKDESGYHYALRLPGADRHTDLSRAQLHTQLKALKNQYGIKLYTAVWFPDDTSLSHAEASSFTSRIHSLYDYYYSKN